MARTLLAVVGTLLVWLMISLLTVAVSLTIILCALPFWLIDRQRRSLHGLASLWGQAIFAAHPGWRVTVTGRKHIEPHTAYIIISNHQSLLDIMALFCVRRQFKWVAKDSLFMIPFLGWAMALAGYIKLARGRHGSIRETYDRAKQWLASGISVFFFPEGTRSRTGELGPFKNGAFKLALETGVAVVPIVVSGTRDLLARNSWVFRHRCRVRIMVLAPLDPKRYRSDEADRFRDEAHRLISQTLHEASRPT